MSYHSLNVNIPAGNGKPLKIDYLSRQEILLRMVVSYTNEIQPPQPYEAASR
jgi:hypothetical protein